MTNLKFGLSLELFERLSYVYVHICMYVCIYLCVNVCVCVCVCVYISELGGLAIYVLVSVSIFFPWYCGVFSKWVFNLVFLLSKETIHFLV